MIIFQKTNRAAALAASSASHLTVFVDENGILCGKNSAGGIVILEGVDGINGANGTNGTNGRGITSVTLTNTTGLIKTYTIAFTDATSTTFQVSDGSGGTGGTTNVPVYSADITTGRSILSTDLQAGPLVYNAAANADFTIPNDSTLSLTGSTNNTFEIYQKGNGVPNIIAGTGVTLVKWAGYPTSTLGVTQTAHRVGANTWAVK